MELQDIINYLDNYLDVKNVQDYPNAYNGLQVYGPKGIQHVAVAVDATLYSITEAVRMGAEMLLVHHGLFWNFGPLTGTFYDRISTCIKNDLAVYSVHIPLDVHPEVGNNHVLMRRLGFEPEGMWMPYLDHDIGVWASANILLGDFVARMEDILGFPEKVFPFGDQHIKRFGVITGGAGGGKFIRAAKDFGLDLLITGEGSHDAVFEMEELGINCIYAGHYLTETVGIQSLASHLEAEFGLETFFIDHPSGL